MLNCQVDDYYNAGMYALFNVTKCNGKSGHVPTVILVVGKSGHTTSRQTRYRGIMGRLV